MSTDETEPVDIDAQLYQMQVQINGLLERVEQQGRNIDALVASLPKASQTPAPVTRGGRTTSAGKVYREWVGWLQLNGPAYRQEVMDGVGKPLPGNQPVVDWTSIMATWPETSVPLDTLCRINGPSTGQGRPPTVYFLWMHRFDLYRKFGVGPSERPEPIEPMTGVIYPPTEQQTPVLSAETHGVHPNPLESYPRRVKLDPEPKAETPEYDRFDTMEEWQERWNPIFDDLAPYDATPTDEEKAAMRATLPEDTGGEPWTVILTRSYREAKVRSES